MKPSVTKVALLLFGSGTCALVYQTAWFREFRLIFGASTAASAAVLAIFMGGLGLGGLILGARADRSNKPLSMYANLELFIALSAALTPLLLWLTRSAYITVGGTSTLGMAGGTIIRLILATLVLGVPTFLMGGTLPAAARSVETAEDLSRRSLALLYGANTMGAVSGTLLSTFLLIEVFGNRRTLWIACLLNALVALIARNMARSSAEIQPARATETSPVTSASEVPGPERMAPAWFVLAAAAFAGFAFLLMELVWYRMLGPLLGGSSFTFGLILAVALLGIGAGGTAYSLFGSGRPVTLLGFALTCSIEAFFIAVPIALGDRIAILTMLLRPLGAFGFYGHVLAWSGVSFLVVFPAAFISGIQFPLLIALLGRGREAVGRHIGLAYAWNTVGAIIGSLAGGFGLLPILTAPGTWRLVVALLSVLSVAALMLSGDFRTRRVRFAITFAGAAFAVVMLFAEGPTAAWRHAPIGAGRAELNDSTRNGIREFLNAKRRSLAWEAEGLESSVGVTRTDAYSFIINGKSDGNARGDAGTQVMGGLVGAILLPRPTSAFVIGLGTGSTAGWLAAIPSMERVDVVELEPAILKVAAACTPVNAGVLANRKAHISIGDAREVLLTTRRRYDIIFSEPSNPYRAGVASLFTAEFYRASAARLTKDGLFLQWLQAYEVDSETIRTTYATLGSVFLHVDTWQTTSGDLLLVGSLTPIRFDIARIRERIAQEPYRSALLDTWRVDDVEGFLAHFVAGNDVARKSLKAAMDVSEINTDDRNLIEFAFARSVGKRSGFNVNELREYSRKSKTSRPSNLVGSVDWRRVDDALMSFYTAEEKPPIVLPEFDDAQKNRGAALTYFVNGNLKAAREYWFRQTEEPKSPTELALVATALADGGDPRTLSYADLLRKIQPGEADIVLALYHLRGKNFDEAAKSLVNLFTRLRQDPWPLPMMVTRSLNMTPQIAQDASDSARRSLYASLEAPFSVAINDEQRLDTLLRISGIIEGKNYGTYSRKAFRNFEPHVPWSRPFLQSRSECYRATHDPRAAIAAKELNEFLAQESLPFGAGL